MVSAIEDSIDAQGVETSCHRSGKGRTPPALERSSAGVSSGREGDSFQREFLERLRAEWRPGSTLEEMTVDRIAETCARLRHWSAVYETLLATRGNEPAGLFSSLILALRCEQLLSDRLQALICELERLQQKRRRTDPGPIENLETVTTQSTVEVLLPARGWPTHPRRPLTITSAVAFEDNQDQE